MRLPGSCTELWIDRDSEESWIIGKQWVAFSGDCFLTGFGDVSLRRARGQVVRRKRKKKGFEQAPSRLTVSECVCARVNVGLRMRGVRSTGSDSQCQIACRALNNDCMSDATFPLSPGVQLVNGVRAYRPRYLDPTAAA